MAVNLSSWVLKEAGYKALAAYHSSTKINWKSFDLRYLPSGAPVLYFIQPLGHLKNGVQTDPGVELISSLSGDAGVLVGVVIAQQKD